MTHQIFQADGCYYIRRRSPSRSLDLPYEYFAGYDFMGSVTWNKSPFKPAHGLDSLAEAMQILADLEAAEDPAQAAEDPAPAAPGSASMFAVRSTLDKYLAADLVDRIIEDILAADAVGR